MKEWGREKNCHFFISQEELLLFFSKITWYIWGWTVRGFNVDVFAGVELEKRKQKQRLSLKKEKYLWIQEEMGQEQGKDGKQRASRWKAVGPHEGKTWQRKMVRLSVFHHKVVSINALFWTPLRRPISAQCSPVRQAGGLPVKCNHKEWIKFYTSQGRTETASRGCIGSPETKKTPQT